MPYPRKISDDQRALLRQVALTRRYIAEIYRTLPSNKRLAREMGISRGGIEKILAQELAAHDAEQASKVMLNSVSRGTIHGENAPSWPPGLMEFTPNESANESS